MNKEYIYLSDKEILVTDEKGHATKRDIESTDIHNLLLLENDLEKINKKIINEEKEIHRYEESKLPLKEKIFLAAMPFIVGTLIPVCIFINKPNFLYNVFYCSIGMSIFLAGIEASVMLGTRFSTKHINGVKSELATSYQLKDELEQKLNNLKDKSKNSITTTIVKSNDDIKKTDDVIILEEITPFVEAATKQLEESYEAGYNQKGKKLVLKK